MPSYALAGCTGEGPLNERAEDYRSDIDGLRAVAVLAVVAFHAFPHYCPGGFVGVDVFFVISGFLITGILLSALERGRFSVKHFYSRRVRRIFPALLIVLAASWIYGWFALPAAEYQTLGTHIAGGAAFVANLVVWREVGYFDVAAETKPLLHLWSLGIEEQFYIVFPLLLWVAWRSRVRVWIPIALIGVLSFSLNVAIRHSDPSADFYSPLTRSWELMIGSLLAGITRPRLPHAASRAEAPAALAFVRSLLRRPSIRGAVSAIGILFIAASVALLFRGLSFPGVWALVPTVGTAMVIFAGPSAFPNRYLLSNRVLVGVGLVSYPLYLWHWPLLSFARLLAGSMPEVHVRVVAVMTAGVLAVLTYLLVERPLRTGGWTRRHLTASVLLMGGIALVGLTTARMGGLPSRSTLMIQKAGSIGVDEFFDYLKTRYVPCQPPALWDKALTFRTTTRCFQSKNDRPQRIAIVGDSHAEHLFPGFAEALPDKNVVYFIEDYLPLADDERFARIFEYLTSASTIDTVILSAYWHPRLGDLPKDTSALDRLDHTVRTLLAAGKTVYAVSDVPDYIFDASKCKYTPWWGDRTRCEEDSSRFVSREAYVDAILRPLERTRGLRLTVAGQYFCRDGVCSMSKGNTILYRDVHHLNVDGSKFVAQQVIREHPELAR